MQTSFGLYVLVGAGATTLHYAVLFLLVAAAAASPGLAAAAGAACGAAYSYAGVRALVFPEARTPHSQAAPRFLLIAGSSALISGGMVSAGTSITAGGLWFWQAMATCLTLVLGFIANKRWTFS